MLPFPRPSLAPLLSLALFAASTPSDAQVPIGREFPLVPGSTTNSLKWPSVAVAPSGDFVVTFVRRDGPSSTILSRHYDALGAAQGGESTVASGLLLASHDISATGPSGFVVVWPGFDGYRPTVFARRLDPQGIPVGAEFIAPSGTGERDVSPSVSGDPGGGFVVVWATATVAGYATVVSGRRYAADGTPVGAEFRVSDGTLPKLSTSVAVAGEGTFVVGWGDYHYSTPSRAVARRFDAAGAPLTPEVVANPSNSSFSGTTSHVATDSAGHFVVVWKENTIKARKFQADGTPLTGDVSVGDGGLLTGGFHVAGDAAGNVMVTWTEMRGLAEDVRGRRIDASAAPGPIFRVSSHVRQYNMGGALSMNADGRAIVAWDSTTDLNRPGLPMARRYGPIGPAALEVDPAPAPLSDGNRVLEPGETSLVAPRWRIDGAAAQALAGQATTLTGPPGGIYGVVDASARYPFIPNGGVRSCLDTPDCYAVSVAAASRPAVHWDALLREDVMGLQAESMGWALHIGDSFADVTRGDPFYQFVETVLHRGVSAGCGGGAYCPDSPATRAQSAVFLLVARDGAGFRPSGPCWQQFNDVPVGNPFCAWIEKLSAEGVVTGCGDGRFCPDAAATREQMAVLVLRTLDRATNPPACTVPRFADVPAASPFCRWIEELARRGVVTGCGAGNYCPQAAVTRGQMAVFIAQAFGLQLYGP